jgi:hypothetical protein
LCYPDPVILAQQRFWLGLVNSRESWTGEEEFLRAVPEEFRAFPDPPGWPRQKAMNYLANNVELLRAAHRALETGERLDVDMLNTVLSEGILRLRAWGGLDEIRAAREQASPQGGRVETLLALSRRDGLNPGTAWVRDTVERAFYYFAQYVDYRIGDAAYPDASPGTFQVRACLLESCGKLFIRTAETPLYCSEACAIVDG